MSSKHRRSLPANQKQKHHETAPGDAQSADSAVPEDYPLVPLTNEIIGLKEAYSAAQKENEIQQAKQLTTQRVLCFITFLGFSAAAIYAWVTYQQWRDLKANFEKDERPIIWLSEKVQDPSGPQLAVTEDGGVKSTHIAWNLHYTNYGKSPANNINLSVAIAVGNVPGEAIAAPPKWTTLERGAPIPTGKDDFTTVMLSEPITEAQFQELLAADKSIVVRMLFKYSGISTGNYETRLCITRLRSGAVQYCPTENENYIH